jgi:hypothetical protein
LPVTRSKTNTSWGLRYALHSSKGYTVWNDLEWSRVQAQA